MKVLALAVLSVAVMLPGCARKEISPPPLDTHPGVFTSAARCGDCHTDIYRVWTSSLHAASFSNETFQASLKELPKGRGDPTGQVCIGCHAPATTQAVAGEGVTCDYCHSIQSIDTTKRPILTTVSVGAVKYGPVPNAHSTGHEIAASPLHADSAICSGCHEYRNPAGLDVLSTFSEWQDSDIGKAGMTCQRCHMPLSSLKVVDPRVKREPTSWVNLHKMPGAHSKDQLSKALDFQIAEVRRTGNTLHVSVVIKNHGAGHSVPTGMPTRAIVLAAEASGSISGVHQETKTYGTTVADAAGQRLDHDSQIMVSGAKLVTDTRLRPSEERKEEFSFNISPDENVDIRVTLTYRYSPFGQDQPGVGFEFAERTQRSVMQFVGRK